MQDRAISSDFSTHRVSQQTTIGNFQKFFLPLKIMNFRIFAKNTKTLICFYLLNHARYSDFVGIFDPQGILANYSLQFSKNFLPFLPKMQKHKFAFIFLTVWDRAISSKFSIPRVTWQTTLCNYWRLFPKIVFPTFLAAILNFCVKCKNTMILETVRDRVIFFNPQGICIVY